MCRFVPGSLVEATTACTRVSTTVVADGGGCEGIEAFEGLRGFEGVKFARPTLPTYLVCRLASQSLVPAMSHVYRHDLLVARTILLYITGQICCQPFESILFNVKSTGAYL